MAGDFTTFTHLDESSIDAFDLPNRRPTHIVNTPALISHFVFWPSKTHPNWANAAEQAKQSDDPDIALARNGGETDTRVVVASALNAYLKRFRRKIGAQGNCRVPLFTCDPAVERASLSKERNGEASHATPYVMFGRTLALEGEVRNFVFDMTADIYSEQFSLSFRLFPAAIPAHSVDETSQLALAQRVLRDLVDPNTGELEWMREGRHTDYRPHPDEATLSPRRLAGHRLQQADKLANEWIRCVYSEIWSEFFEALQDAFQDEDSFEPTALTGPSGGLPASLAGVFRNLVIRTMPDSEQRACQNERPRKSASQTDQMIQQSDQLPVIEGDRSLVLRNVPPGVLGHGNERAEMALDGFASKPHGDTYRDVRMRVTEHLNHRSVLFGRLLGYRARSRWIEDLQSGNAALSVVLDGLAVHGSTLGIHTHPDQQFPHNEVRHFVIYGGPSRQQLGRLVRNLHAVGEYRLLALRGHRDVEIAARKLDTIWQRFGDVEAALVRKDIEEANKQLLEIGEFLAQVKASVADGGLEHRLMQPATCMTHLSRFLEALRVRRIEGWRPFGEFIARSVAPHVTYMQSIGARLETVETALRAAEARVISHNLAEKTTDIAVLQRIHLKTNRKLLRQGERVDALTMITAGLGIMAAAEPLSKTFLLLPQLFGADAWPSQGFDTVIGAIALFVIIFGLWKSVWAGRGYPETTSEDASEGERNVDEGESSR